MGFQVCAKRRQALYPTALCLQCIAEPIVYEDDKRKDKFRVQTFLAMQPFF